MTTDKITVVPLDEWLDAPTTLDALPHNIRAGRSVTVSVCAEPGPNGRPCRVVLDAGRLCALHGQPTDPHRVTVSSAWDAEHNRTMTHSMWRCP